MKKRKRIILFTTFCLFLVGTIASAAIVLHGADRTINPLPADIAVLLEFGDALVLDDVGGLSTTEAKYRNVIIKEPLKSAGFNEPNFETAVVITYEDGIAGVVIDVATTPWHEENVPLDPAPDSAATITHQEPANMAELVPNWENAVDGKLTYYLKFLLDETTYVAENAGEEGYAGKVKIAYTATITGAGA